MFAKADILVVLQSAIIRPDLPDFIVNEQLIIDDSYRNITRNEKSFSSE